MFEFIIVIFLSVIVGYLLGLLISKHFIKKPNTINLTKIFEAGKNPSHEEMDKLFKEYKIKSINVLKGEQAIKKYPKDGKYGVVLITTKNSDNVIVTSKTSVDTVVL